MKNLNEGGRGSEAEGYRAAPPSQLEVEHPTVKPEGKSVKGNTAHNTLTRWITGTASNS
ncbi:hypothetical protein TSAR_015324 [Trichomalopsis sarcophagae]|uniref:Uncharacterized protein n=1 Tax=Trichomalopsis sarcophagae TaxID=543379 RepID=A0A232EPE9_9HYME|nr:hypothetical protein TSAR_015324 [Trichomalopsis sarcophagae]